MRSRSRHSVDRRRRQRDAIALLIVIAMLTLFSVIALSFVFYAEAEAVAAQATSAGLNKPAPDADPELLLSYFLSQFIYGTTNVNSAIRGHDLGTTMYGYNSSAMNTGAFSGAGRWHWTNAIGLDDYYCVNSQYYPADGFAQRTPEMFNGTYRGWNVPYTYPDLNNMFLGQL